MPAIVLAAFVALKPVFDMAWELSVPVMGKPLNVQGVLALALLPVGVVLSLLALSGRTARAVPKALAGAFLGFCLIAALRGWERADFLYLNVKYMAAFAGIPALVWLFARIGADAKARKLVTWVAAVSLAIVFATAIAQLLGVIKWTYIDYIRVAEESRTYTVGRLTGFYKHPLDLFRVVIWLHLGLIVYLLASKRPHWSAWAVLVATQFLLFRSTHRTSLIFCVGVPLVFLWKGARLERSGLFKRAATVALVVAGSWLPWQFVPGNPVTPYQVFGLRYFFSTKEIKKTDEAGVVTTEERVEAGRGRLWNWIGHAKFMATWGPRDWLIGTNRRLPAGSTASRDPHNTLIDLIERFGLLGLGLVLTLYAAAIRAIPVARAWKTALVAATVWYSIPAEPLLMPTFVWWSFLFVAVPLWAAEPLRRILGGLRFAPGNGRQAFPGETLPRYASTPLPGSPS